MNEFSEDDSSEQSTPQHEYLMNLMISEEVNAEEDDNDGTLNDFEGNDSIIIDKSFKPLVILLSFSSYF